MLMPLGGPFKPCSLPEIIEDHVADTLWCLGWINKLKPDECDGEPYKCLELEGWKSCPSNCKIKMNIINYNCISFENFLYEMKNHDWVV